MEAFLLRNVLSLVLLTFVINSIKTLKQYMHDYTALWHNSWTSRSIDWISQVDRFSERKVRPMLSIQYPIIRKYIYLVKIIISSSTKCSSSFERSWMAPQECSTALATCWLCNYSSVHEESWKVRGQVE